MRGRAPAALIPARQWIPREHVDASGMRKIMKLLTDLAFRTKWRLAIDLIGEVFADDLVSAHTTAMTHAAHRIVSHGSPEVADTCTIAIAIAIAAPTSTTTQKAAIHRLI